MNVTELRCLECTSRSILRPSHYTIRNLFIETVENGLFKVAPSCPQGKASLAPARPHPFRGERAQPMYDPNCGNSTVPCLDYKELAHQTELSLGNCNQAKESCPDPPPQYAATRK